MTLLRIVALVAVDVIATAALSTAFAIACGLSGAFHVGPWLVSATSARNPLTIGAAALVIRSVSPDVPFLGAISLSTLAQSALVACHRIHDMLLGLTLDRAQTLVYGVMGVSLAVKLILAFRHPGFWTGDDVEIHEMTFARLFGYPAETWNLRSPFYPLGVIYPVQALLVRAGQTDPAWLVFAGRAVVGTCTVVTLCLTFHVARRLFDSVPIAVLSVLVLATNKLHTMTGTTELPRPVSSLLVLTAFWLLFAHRRAPAALAAGALVGVASAMRFSEEIFIVPAIVQLGVDRRWRDILLLAVGFATAAAIALGPIDALYWGEPFFSVRHIVEFTLTNRLSSRGYQPWYEYVSAIPTWTNIGVAALAVYATLKLRLWTLAAWAWFPVAALSLLPHKEPGYLVPILPFYAILAAAGLWRGIVWLRQSAPLVRDPPRERAALVLVVAASAVLMTEPAAYVLPRSDGGVAIARDIAANPRGGLLAQSAWNLGGRIYLPRVNPLIDMDPSQIRDRSQMNTALRTPGIVWLVLHDREVRRPGYESMIAAAGFDEVTIPEGMSPYRVYRRR